MNARYRGNSSSLICFRDRLEGLFALDVDRLVLVRPPGHRGELAIVHLVGDDVGERQLQGEETGLVHDFLRGVVTDAARLRAVADRLGLGPAADDRLELLAAVYVWAHPPQA
jgi:hypothetical protein